ncbi:hypothetical protein GCM10029992_30520 [Glycomyces albus]
MTVGGPVWAQDEESGGGEKLCDLHDPRLENPAGIAAADDGGWWVVPSGENQDATLSIQHVRTDCNPEESGEVWIDHTPLDPQSLLVSDGFLWVGDTGGATDRPWITLNQIELGQIDNNVAFRYLFPGSPEEVEAFVILPGDDRKPVFFSAADGETTLYSPPGENLTENTPMDAIGTAALPEGGTVTGAALNADATKIVLRTETAAYEYDVADGDVAAAVTEGEPLVTPLADEGQAQDITYDADGNFVTLASVDSSDPFGSITTYTPAAPAAEDGGGDGEGSGGDSSAAEDDESIVDWILGLGFTNIIRILTAIAVVGFGVMLGGILVIRKHRRRRREGAEDEELGAAEESAFDDFKDDPLPRDPVDIGLDAGQPDPEVGKLAQGAGSVYGAPRQEPSGNVYGAPKPSPGGGAVYGAPKEEPAPGRIRRNTARSSRPARGASTARPGGPSRPNPGSPRPGRPTAPPPRAGRCVRSLARCGRNRVRGRKQRTDPGAG